MNPRTRRAALYAIGAIAIAASVNALAHSYAGLYDWAAGHRLSGWQAMSWPAEIDVFLAIGELALYVAYLDDWPPQQRIWPWTTALAGLAVSIAANIGHIQPHPGQPVILADRMTAATSPIAAFAGLTVGLLVLKMSCRQPSGRPRETSAAAKPATHPADSGWLSYAANGTLVPVSQQRNAAGQPAANATSPVQAGTVLNGTPARRPPRAAGDGETPSSPHPGPGTTRRHALLRDASLIYQTAASRGERVSQRMLASQLRGHGHQFSNQHLHAIAASAGLGPGRVRVTR